MVEEWSRVVSQTVQVEGKEVSILITEYYTADQPGAPKRCKFSGPNGLFASSWPEMLEKLGIAPPSLPALPKASRSRVDEAGLKRPSEYSQEREIATAEARESDPLVDAHEPPRMDTDSKSNPARDAANPVAVNDPPKRVLWQTRPGPFLPKNRKLRTDPKRLDEIDSLEVQMGLLWWAEQVKQGYPERYEALFDREKYQALLDREDVEEPVPEPDKAPRCRFIKSDGQTCAAYAIKNKRLCYFHSQTSDGRKKKKLRPLQVPVLEDDLAVQMTVTNICRGLAEESLEPKRAATLLYGLQVATAALRRNAAKKEINV